jgi:hypothetical protein
MKEGRIRFAAESRSCGNCTACCDGWLKITVFGAPVYPGQPCPHSSGHHCLIYDRRPVEPCQRFRCGWLVPNSPLPEWLRPDQAKVIFLPSQFDWNHQRVDVAVPVGGGPDATSLQWFKDFALANKRLLIYCEGEDWFAFGPPAFQLEMQQRMVRGDKLW